MKLWGKVKEPTQARKLKPGAFVPLVDVEPGYVDWVRSSKTAEKHGHRATVRLDLVGDKIQVRAGDGSVIGYMDHARVPQYVGEFERLQARGQYGVADVLISPLGKSERHVLCINYDAACRDGGIV